MSTGRGDLDGITGVRLAHHIGEVDSGLGRRRRSVDPIIELSGAGATRLQATMTTPGFGNCTEPSNVKAGGGACPIRFQCAGCGFYRPDPSYLPALEEHIHSLQADRETARAMGAADYVIANMSTEIDAFTRVVDTMRRRLAELDPEQRAEVEESSRILRRARAARRIPLIATTAKETG
jgi:hypothetical protein